MTWILMMYLSSRSTTVTVIEFNNLESCQSAYSHFVKGIPNKDYMGLNAVYAVCVPKGEKHGL